MKDEVSHMMYPKMVEDFAKENFNLKLLSAVSLALLFVSVATIAVQLRRAPVVIALAENGQVAKLETKVTDFQIREAVRNYLSHRYSWSDSTIASQLKIAEFFIDSSLLGSFRKGLIETTKYVHEKHVKQRIYPREDSFLIDFKAKTVSLVADRITEFDSLKAATEMKLTLWFDMGEATPQNPWGVYIEREQEVGAR